MTLTATRHRRRLCVTVSNVGYSSPGYQKRYVSVFWCTRKEDGSYDRCISRGVVIKFQSHGADAPEADGKAVSDYAPYVTFEPSESNAKLAVRVSKALRQTMGLGHHQNMLLPFLANLNAQRVEIGKDAWTWNGVTLEGRPRS